jgi:hypothetical protein
LSGLDTLLPDAELPASLLRAARSFAVASIVFFGIIFARSETLAVKSFFKLVSPPGPYSPHSVLSEKYPRRYTRLV